MFVSKLFRTLFPSLKYRDSSIETYSTESNFYSSNNWARSLVVSKFLDSVLPILVNTPSLKIAVVGGSSREPEVLALNSSGLVFTVDVLGIEHPPNYDLNELNSGFGKTYDLVLCSQVLEHVWHHGNSFNNLRSLLAPNGLLWVAAPFSNRAHGSPDYFAAGFTPSYISKNLEAIGLEILESGQLGSFRNYIALHLMPTWLSRRAHKLPFLFAFDEYSISKRLLFRLRYFHRLLWLQLFSGKISGDSQVATESWVLARLK